VKGKFVAYYRVSTQKQGRSGLGLDAQKEAVTNYLNGGNWSLIAEAVEIESGKRSDRPELAKAMALCRIHRATLLVAKLDRLARNVAFVSALMEAGVKFQAVDLPEANDLTIHIMAAMAEYEAKAISARTKAALAAAKARGTKLGGWRSNITKVSVQGRQAALKVRRMKAAKYQADIIPIIRQHQKNGAATLSAIADALNAEGTPTRRGGQWSPVQVKRILDVAF
jgi:DNA invertase Pin-like site-specific DNA recombinase